MAGFSSEWIKTFPVHSGSGMEQVGNNTWKSDKCHLRLLLLKQMREAGIRTWRIRAVKDYCVKNSKMVKSWDLSLKTSKKTAKQISQQSCESLLQFPICCFSFILLLSNCWQKRFSLAMMFLETAPQVCDWITLASMVPLATCQIYHVGSFVNIFPTSGPISGMSRWMFLYQGSMVASSWQQAQGHDTWSTVYLCKMAEIG